TTFSSFLGTKQRGVIEFEWVHGPPERPDMEVLSLRPEPASDVYSKWVCDKRFAADGSPNLARSARRLLVYDWALHFTIFSLNTVALRGIESPSKRTPLGVNGENLDVLLSTFDKTQRAEILARLKVISWIERFVVDPSDKLKYEGHKLGRSTSTLYFKDR